MKLKIEAPCHEDWDKMTIGMNSRHCAVCVKSVVDFTKMNRAEIITYMLSNPNDSVCGRMTKDQFDFRHEDIPILIETLKIQKPSNSFLILALVCMSLTACAQEKPMDTLNQSIKVPIINHSTMGKMRVSTSDSAKVAVPAVVDSQNASAVLTDCAMEIGEVEMQGEVEIMGDMIMEEPEIALPKSDVLQFAEKMPEYNGGVDQMMKFIKNNLHYPEFEKSKNLQGNVYARFIVNTDGSISGIKILRSVPGSINFDSEVIRVIKAMPRWLPGENKGKKVSVFMTLPFQFKIS